MSSGLSKWGVRLVTVGGLGHLPASGTWGSLPPVILAGVLMALGIAPGHGVGAWIVYHLVVIVVLIASILVCATVGDAAEARFGYDPGEVVADEVAGQCIPLLFLPAAATASFWPAVLTLVCAFLAFRLFDIVKPWPARELQLVPGGWGVVLDDLAAGVQAFLLVQVVVRLVL